MRARVDEQRRISQLLARIKRRLQDAGRRAIARVVHDALRGIAGQRQAHALARHA